MTSDAPLADLEVNHNPKVSQIFPIAINGLVDLSDLPDLFCQAVAFQCCLSDFCFRSDRSDRSAKALKQKGFYVSDLQRSDGGRSDRSDRTAGRRVLPFNSILRVGATPGFRAVRLKFTPKNNCLGRVDHEYDA